MAESAEIPVTLTHSIYYQVNKIYSTNETSALNPLSSLELLFTT